MMGFRFPAYWVRGFFLGFSGYKGQSALCFLEGRSSRFLQFFAVCSIMSRQEIFLVRVCSILYIYFGIK
jgi:hypothetical protein